MLLHDINSANAIAAKRNPGPVLLPILGRVPNPAEPGIPIDVSRANLFDTAYVHRILRRKDDWLWEYYRLYIATLLWLSSGTTAGMDQWAGAISPARHHPSKSNNAPACRRADTQRKCANCSQYSSTSR